jgi:hypothetical protein
MVSMFKWDIQPYVGAWSVHDLMLKNHRDFVQGLWKEKEWDFTELKHDYFKLYKQWMFEPHPRIQGTDWYSEPCFTQGTTESFNLFYIRYSDKRLRIARGEYFYHNMIGKLYDKPFAFLDEDDLQEGDAVVLSVPFSDTGNVPYYLEEILTECDLKGIPVMLDLAYLNLAKDLSFDLRHECIEYITSSLSKSFPLELSRIGIRFQKSSFEDQLNIMNEDKLNYINMHSLYLGYHMMERFKADWLYTKYRYPQLLICEELEVEPSSCVIFGIDSKNKYPEYNRGGETNRLCFSRVWDGRNIAKREKL